MIPPPVMTVKQQRTRRGRAREMLLDSAARVFTERGFRGATVDAILDHAGLSKGTFYWHFESKDELVLAVLAERVERPIKELIEMLRSAPADENMSLVANRRFAEFVERGRDSILLEHEYEGLAARDPRLRRRYARQRRQLRAARAVDQPLPQFHIYDGAAAGDHGDGHSGDRSGGARTGAARGVVE